MTEWNLLIYAGMFVATLAFVRISLVFFPHTDVFIFGYNVHHLFSGSFFLVLLAPLLLAGFSGYIAAILAGAFSALIVDQLVCLVVGDCNEEKYPGKSSLLGMFFFAAVVLVEVALIYFFSADI
jgi:hypothetical protein